MLLNYDDLLLFCLLFPTEDFMLILNIWVSLLSTAKFSITNLKYSLLVGNVYFFFLGFLNNSLQLDSS